MLTRQVATRLFSTVPRLQKGPLETVKDAAKKVDRTISDGLVEGIDQTEKVAGKVKEATGLGKGDLKGKAKEAAGEAKGKASEVTGQARGKASEVTGKAKGKVEEMKGV